MSQEFLRPVDHGDRQAPRLNMNIALGRRYGGGWGRYQWLTILSLAMIRNSGQYLADNFVFLTLA